MFQISLKVEEDTLDKLNTRLSATHSLVRKPHSLLYVCFFTYCGDIFAAKHLILQIFPEIIESSSIISAMMSLSSVLCPLSLHQLRFFLFLMPVFFCLIQNVWKDNYGSLTARCGTPSRKRLNWFGIVTFR